MRQADRGRHRAPSRSRTPKLDRVANQPETAFTDASLLGTERVIYRARLHWLPLLPLPVLFLLFTFVLWSGGLTGAGFVCLLAAAGLAIGQAMKYSSSEFALTDRRLMAKIGIIATRSFELLLPKVESVAVEQGILGRLFDYGTVVVIGTGGSRESFKNIAEPV